MFPDRLFVFFVNCVFGISLAAGADLPSPPPIASDKAVLGALRSSQTPIRKVREIPYYAILELARQSEDVEFKIASPNEEFNGGDNILDAQLPRRQLLFGGSSKRYAFICYFRGGVGMSLCLVAFQLDRLHHSARAIFMAQLQVDPSRYVRPPKNRAELLKAYRANQLIRYEQPSITF